MTFPWILSESLRDMHRSVTHTPYFPILHELQYNKAYHLISHMMHITILKSVDFWSSTLVPIQQICFKWPRCSLLQCKIYIWAFLFLIDVLILCSWWVFPCLMYSFCWLPAFHFEFASPFGMSVLIRICIKTLSDLLKVIYLFHCSHLHNSYC